jgi:hypothetical protein
MIGGSKFPGGRNTISRLSPRSHNNTV